MTETTPLEVFLGTKAQYIKTAPVLRRLDREGVPYRLIDSGQHAAFAIDLRRELGVREPDVTLGGDNDIVTSLQAALWFVRELGRSIFRRRTLTQKVFSPASHYCLIHGDTPTTLLSLVMAKLAGKKVAHLEAGLRSYNPLKPFPEELIRVICMRWSDVLYAPSDWAADNLRRMGVRGDVVPIEHNTNVEAASFALACSNELGENIGPFCFVTAHRVETLFNRSRMEQVVALTCRAAAQMRVIFVMHGPTRRRLEHLGLMKALTDKPNIEIWTLMPHGELLRLMTAAEFLVTDGGSIQEEASYLGVPCLLLRSETERQEGVKTNVVLSHFDSNIIEDFLLNYARLRRPSAVDSVEPSRIVVKDLRRRLKMASGQISDKEPRKAVGTENESSA